VFEFLASPLAAVPILGLGAAMLLWLRDRARARQQRLREAAYQLIHELKAYSAWIELLHGEPFTNDEPEQLTAAQTLRNARAIAQREFPQLSPAILRLLQGDSRLMAHLWQQKVLRLSDPGAWVPYDRDRGYREIRDGQDDLIEEIIARCQVLIGEHGRVWRGTEIDSEFLSSMGFSTQPCR
jgi:hypothetical protein